MNELTAIIIIGIVALSSLVGTVYLILIAPKPLRPEKGKRFSQIREGEKTVSTKTLDNKQYLLDEDGHVLDLKRISGPPKNQQT